MVVGIIYEGGLFFGLFKFYYFEFICIFELGSVDNFVVCSEKYSVDNVNIFLEISCIYGFLGFV